MVRRWVTLACAGPELRVFTKALYYPDMRIPDDPWLRRAILYWDEVNPIVPWRAQGKIPSDHVSHELKRAKALRFIEPESEIVTHMDAEEFSGTFLELVGDQSFLSRIGPSSRRSFGFKVHRDKLTGKLEKELKRRRLARRSDEEWLEFEPTTGMLYMGYLAAELASVVRPPLQPVTNREAYAEPFLRATLRPATGREAFLRLALDDVLPTPSEDVAVSKILAFKSESEHRAALLRFREALRRFCSGIEDTRALTEPDERGRRELDKRTKRELDEKVSELADKLELEKLELAERLEGNGIRTFFAALEALRLTPVEVTLASQVPAGPVAVGAKKLFRIGRIMLNGELRRREILRQADFGYVYAAERALPAHT